MKRIMTYMSVLVRVVRYNIVLIFGNKFFWFLLSSLLFFGLFMYLKVNSGDEINDGSLYNIMLLPAMLLVFYPAVFGIQNDEDNRILEILFGIPNYRYKVWLLRLMIIYAVVFCVLIVFGYIAIYMIYPINPFKMAFQLMFPVFFMGNLAFLLSTITRSGNGTAVLIIIIGLLLYILSNLFYASMWYIFLNPYEIPWDTHPSVWAMTVLKNRLFLFGGAVVLIMLGLMNLQKREKFI